MMSYPFERKGNAIIIRQVSSLGLGLCCLERGMHAKGDLCILTSVEFTAIPGRYCVIKRGNATANLLSSSPFLLNCSTEFCKSLQSKHWIHTGRRSSGYCLCSTNFAYGNLRTNLFDFTDQSNNEF